jgi:hypothetical protein
VVLGLIAAPQSPLAAHAPSHVALVAVLPWLVPPRSAVQVAGHLPGGRVQVGRLPALLLVSGLLNGVKLSTALSMYSDSFTC